MHFYLCPPKVDLRGFSVTQGVIPLQKQYNESYCIFRDSVHKKLRRGVVVVEHEG
jgi:hypothetical protein